MRQDLDLHGRHENSAHSLTRPGRPALCRLFSEVEQAFGRVEHDARDSRGRPRSTIGRPRTGRARPCRRLVSTESSGPAAVRSSPAAVAERPARSRPRRPSPGPRGRRRTRAAPACASPGRDAQVAARERAGGLDSVHPSKASSSRFPWGRTAASVSGRSLAPPRQREDAPRREALGEVGPDLGRDLARESVGPLDAADDEESRRTSRHPRGCAPCDLVADADQDALAACRGGRRRRSRAARESCGPRGRSGGRGRARARRCRRRAVWPSKLS